MLEEKKIDTTDRISMLPDFIIHHIFSYLRRNTESLIRMSVVSKQWFALTASFPYLYFNLGAWTNFFSQEMDTFYRYVEYAVSRFCKQNISAHTLDIYAEYSYLDQIELFGRCLESLIKKGLQVLVIRIVSLDSNLPMFRLPNTLLSASLLTSLTLHKCELPLFLMDYDVKLQSLRLLSLIELPIDEGMFKYLSKGCPLLEEIYLRFCYGFTAFCVNRHYNLQKITIFSNIGLQRIDVDAPNLSYFSFKNDTNKESSIMMASCNKLTTFCYGGFSLKSINDFFSNFAFLENVFLNLSSPVNNLKLSHHFLKRLELQSDCDLEEIYLNAPNLFMFKYNDITFRNNDLAMSSKNSSLAKGYMKCHTDKDFDILSFQKLRRFLEKNGTFKVLDLVICWKLLDVEELKLIQTPPYEIEHVHLRRLSFIRESSFYISLVDAVLWCCRPRSLSLELYLCTYKSHIAKYTSQKLLQQEDECQTYIKFVLSTFSKDEQYFSDFNSFLKALSIVQSRCKITFIKVKKAKKVSKSKPRTPALHPPYFEMIKEAIISLKEKTGSSKYAITKFIEEKQKNLPANFKKVLLTQLKKLDAGGKLVKVKASYKLPAANSTSTAGLAKEKKKIASKPKAMTAAKKVPAAKAVEKAKTSVKAKPAAKANIVLKAVVKPKAAAVKFKGCESEESDWS